MIFIFIVRVASQSRHETLRSDVRIRRLTRIRGLTQEFLPSRENWTRQNVMDLVLHRFLWRPTVVWASGQWRNSDACRASLHISRGPSVQARPSCMPRRGTSSRRPSYTSLQTSRCYPLVTRRESTMHEPVRHAIVSEVVDAVMQPDFKRV